jgi:WXG100 family type VII secretion target
VEGFDATPVELQVCGSMLADISREVHDKVRILKTEVDDLLNGGWTGSAANGFAQGWEQWHAGAVEVLDALKSMAHLLGATGRDYGLADGSSADTLNRSGDDL